WVEEYRIDSSMNDPDEERLAGFCNPDTHQFFNDTKIQVNFNMLTIVRHCSNSEYLAILLCSHWFNRCQFMSNKGKRYLFWSTPFSWIPQCFTSTSGWHFKMGSRKCDKNSH